MGSSPLYLAIVVVWLIVLVPMLLRRDASDPAPATSRRTDRRGGPGPGGGSDISDDEDEDFIDDESTDEDESDISDNGDSEDTPPPRRAPAAPRARTEAAEDGEESGEPAEETDAEVLSQRGPAPPRVNRARIIARRRRRTTGLVTLIAVTAVAVVAGLGPAWVLIPPALLLTGHLALLREAAKADTERRVAELRHRRRKRREEARRAAEEAERRQREPRVPANVVELDARRSDVYDQYADAHIRAAGD
ncbi:hypothetical protein FHX37_0158 [Haloactinospora alba]|uniref:Uncharacterized protein n=1 Tax=Haloactinospora alba TaxID=405555 RepID=A0A543NEM2_9ACTN|nr:hypothetical protein [Haloactinospora alba]TQN30288.1 hypothetical protein FHX37_0158 [Haloactinospora alba]